MTRYRYGTYMLTGPGLAGAGRRGDVIQALMRGRIIFLCHWAVGFLRQWDGMGVRCDTLEAMVCMLHPELTPVSMMKHASLVRAALILYAGPHTLDSPGHLLAEIEYLSELVLMGYINEARIMRDAGLEVAS